MSRHGEITRPFGDQERTFRLTPTKGWAKIQERCDAGPPVLLARLAGGLVALNAVKAGKLTLTDAISMGALGTWRVEDIREPIYQGLIGGGMDPTEAGKLVRELVDERPLLEPLPLAYEVMLASVIGAEDEVLGEPAGRTTETETRPSPTAS